MGRTAIRRPTTWCSGYCNNPTAVVPSCALNEFDVRDKLAGCAGDPIVGGCHSGADRPTDFLLDVSDPNADPVDALRNYVGEPATV
ncbi:MAG: hypothetical protein R3A47_04890 [Polyangiales bacterium]